MITLTGPAFIASETININVGGTFTDPGATASDNVDGNITSSISISGSVDTSTAGTYIISYNVSDAAGNAATEVQRTVIVSVAAADTTPPVITLTGSSTINLTVGDTFTDPLATATDDVDGYIGPSIFTSGSVDTSTAGTYTISYNVSDAAGNAATEVQRTVIVSAAADTTPPVITLIGMAGSSTINLTVGDTWIDPGVTASDNVDGNITSSISTSGSVDTSSAGTYIITYSVSDAAGNTASVSRNVIVDAADTTAPVISLTGSSTINLSVGDTFTDPGATATDGVDGDLTSSISISGSVDTSTAGTYTLSYNVSDAAGNAATEVQRTVIVQ